MNHTESEPLFDAVIYPHRSLGPRGVRNIILGLAGALSLVAIYFTAMGAWPVLPFFGCEILLIWWAFKASARDGRASERVRLTQDELTVARMRPSGREQHHRIAPPHWLRVDLTARPGGANELRLASHGRSLKVGGFLTPEERGELAEELRVAVQRLRRT
ncbi:MAG: DUF2244 domain-containing protein [Alphaproteobacteria bacterium]|nr:DUF2244 domain-containing protein [Alphaproteobacteria bacterium]